MSAMDLVPVGPFRAVLWDIDGTLADSEPVHERSFADACAGLGLSLPERFHEIMLGRSDEETHLWLAENCGLSLSLPAWNEQRFAAYFARIDEVRAHASALDLWHRLDGQGVAQGTVSNSDRRIVDANLGRIGLARPDRVSISRNDVTRGKPDPEPYLRAADLIGASPDDIAVVEDSATGLRSAQAAGMRAFMMPWFEPGAAAGAWAPLSELEDLAAHA